LGKAVVVITGPTCSGKTYLSLRIAEEIGGEIISADSRQVYKYLTIGTAKPDIETLKSVKHYLVDFLEPDEEYNVSKFEHDALVKIKNIFKKNKVPIVSGGSGLYIKALVDGIFDTADKDEVYRKELHQLKDEYGNEFLYNKLKEVDPECASKMLPQNWKRVIRALEVYHLTGKPISLHHKEQKRNIDFIFLQHGLNWQREVLYKRIEKRVDDMISAELVEEVKKILDRGFDSKINSLNTLGYKEIISYLEGEYSIERAIELIKRNTRRFAKRQMTWFRADKRIIWHDVKSQKDIDKIADKIISERKNYERED
jgi:tRNA dimethylallyltransferase